MHDLITSPHNSFIRYCLQLRDNRKRRQSGQFLIDGKEEILRAARSHVKLTKLICHQDQVDADLEKLSQDLSLDLLLLSERIHDKLAYGQTRKQPIALADQPELLLEHLQVDQQSLILVLDQTEKPGNLGACLRTAAAAGVSAVILVQPICDLFNPNAIRASRGTQFGLRIAISSREQVIALAGELSLPIYAARVGVQNCLWELDFRQGGFILFGNETYGLDAHWLSPLVTDFNIPISGLADSLNLSISSAITVYEAKRQREYRPI